MSSDTTMSTNTTTTSDGNEPSDSNEPPEEMQILVSVPRTAFRDIQTNFFPETLHGPAPESLGAAQTAVLAAIRAAPITIQIGFKTTNCLRGAANKIFWVNVQMWWTLGKVLATLEELHEDFHREGLAFARKGDQVFEADTVDEDMRLEDGDKIHMVPEDFWG